MLMLLGMKVVVGKYFSSMHIDIFIEYINIVVFFLNASCVNQAALKNY